MKSHPTTFEAPLPSVSVMSQTRLLVGMSAWVFWGVLAVVLAALGYLYADSLGVLAQSWLEDDNYSHGPFIPLISLYLIWLRRNQLHIVERRGAWWGLPITAVGLIVYVVGEFASMHAVVQLSLWVVIVGLLTCVIGLSGIRLLAFPLLYLLAAIPMPEFLQGELSNRLQLWSSALGIGCLQFIGVMAYREGNVIDLGPIQLQVVEACSGLRYLFPLTALTLLVAYLYRESLWKRVLLVLSSIPISILLNGFRIGTIGLLVETYGKSAADGFSHFFEGWIFFVASLGLLCAEMWLLSRVGSTSPRRPFSELIGPPSVKAGGSERTHADASADRVSPAPLLAGGVLLIVA
ncbi:MAG: exosortase, partial [Nitrospirota bacterium]|nr:exosortase [Nitrospirota bacterium]